MTLCNLFYNIVNPNVNSTKKMGTWNVSFSTKKLKELFITAPILSTLDDEKETVLEADCSGYVIGGCLSQVDDKGILKPVAYMSKKLSPSESNYEIHDKEFLAIIQCLEV